MPVEIAKIKLPHIHRIMTLEQAALVYHRVPGLEGNIAQDLGRDSVRLQIEGIFYGPKAAEDLEALRKVYKKREAVDFLADVVGQAYFGKVTLDRFEVAEVAGEPDQFKYILTVVEYVQPPAATAASSAKVDAAIKVQAKEFIKIASLPASLNSGNLPAITNPAEPLQEAANQITTASQDVQGVTAGLQSLLTLKVEVTPAPALPVGTGQPPADKPLEWVKPAPASTTATPTGATIATGADGQPLVDAAGKPLMAKPFLDANGKQVSGPNGQPLMTTLDGNSLPIPGGKPVAGADGKLIYGTDGQPILAVPAPTTETPGDNPGEQPPTPPSEPAHPVPTSFALIELLDEEGQPVANEVFELKLSNGALKTGKLDSHGQARLEGIAGQSYSVRFPNLDAADWTSAPDPAASSFPAGTAIIELRDEDGQPVANEPYLLTFADGTTRSGKLDAQGLARLTELPEQGQKFRLTFPNLDATDWS